MNSQEASPGNVKEKLAKLCPYLGLLRDSQTALVFPTVSNLCYHAKPLASPNLEYQRSFCLNGKQHVQCPVFFRSKLAPLPPEISGMPANKPLFGKPVEMRILLPILLGCVVLILVGIGVIWLLTGHYGINGILSGQPGSTLSPSGELSLGSATLSITNIAITPNVDLSPIPDTDTPVATPSETGTPLPSQTPARIVISPLPIHTPIPCGSPKTWVIYIVQPGDSLYHLSQIDQVTVAELQQANCLGTSTILHTGQVLYVPPWAPIGPSPIPPTVMPPANTPTDTQVTIPPSDTPIPPTQPPVDTATQPPIPTDVPTDTLASP